MRKSARSADIAGHVESLLVNHWNVKIEFNGLRKSVIVFCNSWRAIFPPHVIPNFCNECQTSLETRRSLEVEVLPRQYKLLQGENALRMVPVGTLTIVP